MDKNRQANRRQTDQKMEAATEISFVSLLPMQYQMEASFVEIYNETLRDLLATSTSDGDTKHEIKMDPNRPGEVYVTNLTPTQVTSEEQVSGKPPSRTNHSVQECYERESEPYCCLKQASVHFSRSQGCWSGQQEIVLLRLPSVTRGPHVATVSSD